MIAAAYLVPVWMAAVALEWIAAVAMAEAAAGNQAMRNYAGKVVQIDAVNVA